MTPPIAQRTFSAADQEAFAALTGDRNPMHMDAAAAKRTQAGACVVHGMHAVLWMLEHSASAGVDLKSITRIKVRFAKFIPVGQSVSARLVVKGAGAADIEALVDDQVVIVVGLGFDPVDASAPEERVPGEAPLVPVPSRPLEPDFSNAGSISGRLLLPAGGDPAALFPKLCAALGGAWVGSMGLLSTVVGMIVPGLHSIFSSLSLDVRAGDARPASVAYRVERSDERFRLVTTAVVGAGLTGEVTAFMRFPPVEVPDMDRVASLVAPDAFKGRVALVIGGSRGIGASVAKLIAAGGGSVVLTYVTGRTEAQAVEADINTHCKQTVCWAARYDALNPDDVAGLGDLARFTHVYYCATTKIFGQGAKVYVRQKFIEFCNVYVDGFHAIAQALLAARPARAPLTILYPSSIAVEDRPKQMTEYAMAKAAGEILCADLAKTYRNLKITVPRLPRILTDQTATVPPVPMADALEIMVPLLLAE